MRTSGKEKLTDGVFRPHARRESTNKQARLAWSGMIIDFVVVVFPVVVELFPGARSFYNEKPQPDGWPGLSQFQQRGRPAFDRAFPVSPDAACFRIRPVDNH